LSPATRAVRTALAKGLLVDPLQIAKMMPASSGVGEKILGDARTTRFAARGPESTYEQSYW
jgi:hypothetical protein